MVLAIYKENKLLKTLNDLGFQDLSKNLKNIFIPMRDSAVSEIEMTNEVLFDFFVLINVFYCL